MDKRTNPELAQYLHEAVEGSKSGTTGWGKKRQKRACVSGLQGPTWTWGAGRGRKDNECGDKWWRPAGVHSCPGGKAVQDSKRGENRVQRAVQLSLRVADGEGVRKRRMTGKIKKIVETVVWG